MECEMTEYNPDNKMKKVVIFELDETLDNWEDYSEQDIKSLLSQMGVKARCMGYKDITFCFESTMESYEDYLGSPVMRVQGWIEKTEQDIEAETKEKEQGRLADELGCTFYEAGQYLMLKNKGIIK